MGNGKGCQRRIALAYSTDAPPWVEAWREQAPSLGEFEPNVRRAFLASHNDRIDNAKRRTLQVRMILMGMIDD